MVDTTTTNYGWTMPEVGASDDTWGDKLNATIAAIDAQVKTVADTVAAGGNIETPAEVLAALLTVDGAGSGVDADKLDGQEGAYYLAASSYTAADVLTKLKTVDGSTSGLDADLLDGNEASAFATSGHNHDATYAKLAGGTLTGVFTQSGLGALTRLADSSMLTGGRIYFTAAGASDPTSLPGDIWFEAA